MEKGRSNYFFFPNGRYIDCSSLTYATSKRKPFNIYIKVLITSSTHKGSRSDAQEVQSVVYHFSPGLPVSFTLCPASQCGALYQMVFVHELAEVAQHAVGVGADSDVVEMGSQGVVPDA